MEGGKGDGRGKGEEIGSNKRVSTRTAHTYSRTSGLSKQSSWHYVRHALCDHQDT